jgi:D-xylose transport system permease protein
MTTATSSRPEGTPEAPISEGETRSPLGAIQQRLRTGELGAWPVIIGLIVIWIVFQSLNSRFLTAQNLSNLTLQIAGVGTISIGVVLVLLLGEIDLSVGSVAGVGAASLAVLSVNRGLPEELALVIVLLIGAAIGTLQGFFFAKVGVPAFVVTLAGNLGWLGLQLWLLVPRGTINFPYEGFIGSLTLRKLSDVAGWVVAAVAVAAYAAAALSGHRRRASAGLPVRSFSAVVARVVGLAAIVGAAVAVLNNYQGVPVALLIFVGLVVIVDLVLRRTRYGRKIFAVGGNIEAARRAGISVAWIRMSVFALCSTFAVFGGVLLASRTFSASQSTGGSETLLMAIAGAVIGGVSLFGGRGSAYGALLGAVVLGSIQSGMLLRSLESSGRFMITAAGLLAAVVLDSLSRRARVARPSLTSASADQRLGTRSRPLKPRSSSITAVE